jgi:hypothetical protein
MCTEANNKQQLLIQLKLAPKSYGVGEANDAILTLKNYSDLPLTVNERMVVSPGAMGDGYPEVRFDIVFPPWECLTNYPFINRGVPERADLALVSPGREVPTARGLSKYYWMKFPRTHEIRATYKNTDDDKRFGPSAWKGEVTLNSVRFEVTE